MEARTFAPDYRRDEKGWIHFPSDVRLRREMFVPEVRDHVAKAQLHLVNALIDYLTETGDTVMDITAGTGSILLAAQRGRKVVCIELRDHYADMIERSAEKMQVTNYLLLRGDCRKYLPIPCQAIIFSPPYSQVLSSHSGMVRKDPKMDRRFGQYQGGEGDLGSLPPFSFNEEMRKIYGLCLQSLTPGGAVALLIKDFYQGELQELGYRHVQMMHRAGFDSMEWYMWAAPGTQFKKMHQMAGDRTVDNEHIIIARKPEV